MQFKEIRRLTDFGCGMTLESQTRIRVRHPATVVHHLYQRFPGIGQDYPYLRGSGVDGILNKFLYHRGRTLYDLPGSYLICHRIRQQLYDVTHFSLFDITKVRFLSPSDNFFRLYLSTIS